MKLSQQLKDIIDRPKSAGFRDDLVEFVLRNKDSILLLFQAVEVGLIVESYRGHLRISVPARDATADYSFDSGPIKLPASH